MKIIGIGIIGGGFAARSHVPAFRADKRCRIQALSLSSEAKAARMAKMLGIPKSFGSWKKIIQDPDVQVISIAVPAILQPEIIQLAIREKKPFFMEKPLAVDVETARMLCREAIAAGIPNAIDFELPQLPAWQNAKRFIADRRLGRIRHVSVNWHVGILANEKKRSSWKTESMQGGGALHLLGSHTFHYLEWMMGPIEAVNARLLKGAGAVGDQETLCAVRVKFKEGFYGNLTIATHCVHGSGHRIEIYGDRGTLVLCNGAKDEIDRFRLFYGSKADRNLRLIPANALKKAKNSKRHNRAVNELVKLFLTAVISGATVEPGIREGLRVQELMDAARRSHAAGGQAVFL